MRNSTLQRKTPMKRAKAARSEGLGRKVEIVMGFYRPPGHKLPTLLRSEQHRRNVGRAGLPGDGEARPGLPCELGEGRRIEGVRQPVLPAEP